jgi:hypothetical protein
MRAAGRPEDTWSDIRRVMAPDLGAGVESHAADFGRLSGANIVAFTTIDRIYAGNLAFQERERNIIPENAVRAARRRQFIPHFYIF